MNPMLAPVEPPPTAHPRRSVWRRVAQAIVAVAAFDLRLRHSASQLKVEDAPLLHRAARGLLYRLLLVPVLICILPALMVWLGTHPDQLAGVSAGTFWPGVHCEEISFRSADGTALRAWIVPVVEARAVIEQGDQALRGRHPAVVLIHGHAAGPAQMVPLVEPLHRAGFVVMLTTVRGSAGASGGTTFGIREAEDVQAAVEALSARRSVDPQRIALLGVETGANAAVLAAERHRAVAALVLENPVMDLREMVLRHVALPQDWLRPLRPVSRWLFELAYRVNVDDAEIQRCRQALSGRPVLVFNSATAPGSVFRRQGLSLASDFLARHLKPARAVVTIDE